MSGTNIKTTYALHKIIPDNRPDGPVLTPNLRPQTKQHTMTWTNIKYWLNKLNNGALIMGLFFLFVVISGIIGSIRMNKMSKRYKITSGYVNRYGQFAKSSVMYIDYNYIVFNEKHESFISLNTDHHEVFVGKYFPVLYDSMDTGVHKILITRSDFVEYGLVPPDSLAWVKKYIKY